MDENPSFFKIFHTVVGETPTSCERRLTDVVGFSSTLSRTTLMFSSVRAIRGLPGFLTSYRVYNVSKISTKRRICFAEGTGSTLLELRNFL